MGRRTLVVTHGVLLAASLAGAVLTSRASDWDPVGLVVLLAALAIASDTMAIETASMRLTGSFIALVLAMVVLGPAPAVAIGLLTVATDAPRLRGKPAALLSNASTFSVFPLAGGLAARALNIEGGDAVNQALGVAAVFAGVNLLNFLLIAVPHIWTDGVPLGRSMRTILVPLMPSEALAGALTVISAAT